jgi:hypothetical protein
LILNKTTGNIIIDEKALGLYGSGTKIPYKFDWKLLMKKTLRNRKRYKWLRKE